MGVNNVVLLGLKLMNSDIENRSRRSPGATALLSRMINELPASQRERQKSDIDFRDNPFACFTADCHFYDKPFIMIKQNFCELFAWHE